MSKSDRSVNRRGSVRMTSRVLFASNVVPLDRYKAIKQDCDDGISLYNRSELADVQSFIGGHNALVRLKEKDKDLADFLQHLDVKLSVLLKKVDPTPSLIDKLVLQKVNISGGGLAFWSKESRSLGEIIEHHIIIPPMKSFITCFCEVISCKQEEDDKGGNIRYRVSEKFCLLMEEDRETLVQFTFQQQGRVLQRRRLGG